MQIENLGSLQVISPIETDLVIIGAGPAGLTIAREFFHTSTRVLILESGELKEQAHFSALNSVESIGEPRHPAQVRTRRKDSGFAVAFLEVRRMHGWASLLCLTKSISPSVTGFLTRGGRSGAKALLPISIAPPRCSTLARIAMMKGYGI